MKYFSERQGLIQPKNIIQRDMMDDELRNGLWNAVSIYFWRELDNHTREYGYRAIGETRKYESFFTYMWIDFFRWRIDQLEDFRYGWRQIKQQLNHTFFTIPWNRVYDFIEFIVFNWPGPQTTVENFIEYTNEVLEREMSAWRIIDNCIAPITSEEEILAVEKAMNDTRHLPSVNEHLARSLELLSDKEKPDFRNSIKESISAIESLCNLINGKSKTSLGKALNKLEPSVSIHPALKKGFEAIYGWTSEADGIRHGLAEASSNVDFEEAMFMLVSCSAFINFLFAKATKAGISLQPEQQ